VNKREKEGKPKRGGWKLYLYVNFDRDKNNIYNFLNGISGIIYPSVI